MIFFLSLKTKTILLYGLNLIKEVVNLHTSHTFVAFFLERLCLVNIEASFDGLAIPLVSKVGVVVGSQEKPRIVLYSTAGFVLLRYEDETT